MFSICHESTCLLTWHSKKITTGSLSCCLRSCVYYQLLTEDLPCCNLLNHAGDLYILQFNCKDNLSFCYTMFFLQWRPVYTALVSSFKAEGAARSQRVNWSSGAGWRQLAWHWMVQGEWPLILHPILLKWYTDQKLRTQKCYFLSGH